MTSRTKAAIAATCVAAAVAPDLSAAGNRAAPRMPGAVRTKVVAELFTSEGCSSCPPADALLRRLLSTQPFEGVEIIALSDHVDYWNDLGWRDPFSSPLLSERQSLYDAAVFRAGRIYTPQLVVDGVLQCVASDAAAVRRTLLRAAMEPKGTVTVSVRPDTPTSTAVTIRVQVPTGVRRDGPAGVIVAVTEDGLISRVQRGENHGRTLSHDAVVRLLMTAGHLGPQQRDLDLSTTLGLDPGWKSGSLRIVAFVQEASSRRIVAAGSSPFVSRHADPR